MKRNLIFSMLLAVFTFLLISCQKDTVNLAGEALLKVEIAGTKSNAQPALKLKSSVRNTVDSKGASFEIPWNNDYVLAVEVSEAGVSSKGKLAASTIMRNPLSSGVQYRLLIFDADKKLINSVDYINGQNSNTEIALSSEETYSFIVYSFNEQSAVPALGFNNGAALKDVLLKLSTVKDLMYSSRLNVKLTVGENRLAFILKHVFTSVKAEIDASDVGNITQFGEFSITNTYGEATAKFYTSKNDSLELSFTNSLASKALESFVVGTDMKIITAEPQLFFANGVKTSNLMLSSLTIAGVRKDNVVLVENFKFRPGIYYTVNIKLKKSAIQGFEIGNILWATGNLVLTGETYSFAGTQGEYGNYWYRNTNGNYYLHPFPGLGGSGQGEGGLVENVCAQVGAGWRIPTSEEVNALATYAKWWENPTNKFEGEYVMKNGTISKGIYFGTDRQPSTADQDKYLFLPFAGAYNTLSAQEIGQSGFYWHTGLGFNNHGTSLQLSNYISPNNNGGLDSRRANSIRCVRDK